MRLRFISPQKFYLVTLFQGAIPIQINGLNALPLSAVKSLPAKVQFLAIPLTKQYQHLRQNTNNS